METFAFFSLFFIGLTGVLFTIGYGGWPRA